MELTGDSHAEYAQPGQAGLLLFWVVKQEFRG